MSTKLRRTEISADFPGGNIVVERAERGSVWLTPDFRHLQEGCQWFYWSFIAANTEPLRVVFSHRNYIGAHGPAVSHDGGKSWKWMGREKVTRVPLGEHQEEFCFEIPPADSGEPVRYGFCPQYQESHLRSWLQRHEGHPALQVLELCKSRNGRAVEQIHIGDMFDDQRKIIWLAARHHSCEAMASYVLEGILEAALGNDDLGTQLRRNWKICAMPFMDKDGVEEGDQGKLRHPHDHNRDYNERAIYPEVAAAMSFGKRNQSAITAFLDLHCPMVHGPWDNRFYAVGSSLPQVSARQDAFMDSFSVVRAGIIKEHSEAVLHFGKAWNTSSNYSAGKSAMKWAEERLPDAALISSFEIPYGNADGIEVNTTTAHALGRDIAAALLRHLRTH